MLIQYWAIVIIQYWEHGVNMRHKIVISRPQAVSQNENSAKGELMCYKGFPLTQRNSKSLNLISFEGRGNPLGTPYEAPIEPLQNAYRAAVGGELVGYPPKGVFA